MGDGGRAQGKSRVETLETLLRRLQWTRTPAEAAALVGRNLSPLVGADQALLYLVTGGSVVAANTAAQRWHALAAAAVTAERPRTAPVAARDGSAALALPLQGAAGPAGAIVLVRLDAEPFDEAALGLVKLFAEHAGAALRGVELPASA